ncbi:MAG: PQQ-binding-like beta-propeller repeat protein, partial [Planctomycetota bacterium]
MVPRALSLACLASALLSVCPARSEDWPQFRGPRGNGAADCAAHPVEWSEDENVDWKVAIDGVAWSQPIVSRGKIFLTTALAEDQPRPRAGEAGPGFSLLSGQGISRLLSGGSAPEIECTWNLLCLDLATGDRLWSQVVRTGQPPVPIHRSNSYASETPVTDGERIYVHLGMAGLYCFDFDGKAIWKQGLPTHAMQYGWGTGSSPLLHEDLLYLLCDNEKASYLTAYEKTTGDVRWRVDRDESSNWSTPYLWRNKDRVELITCGGKRTRSYDPLSGDPYWELPAAGRCATSAVGDAE